MTMPSLQGYSIQDKLYEGKGTLVYRAIKKDNQQSVVIKFLKPMYPSHDELLTFRHQYLLLKNLHIDGILLPLALETNKHSLALIMPDTQMIDLAQWLNKKPIEIDHFFTIALQMVRIIEQLHEHNIIHKDIKPSNFIIDPKTMQLNLIDFHIASNIKSEMQSAIGSKKEYIHMGTLAYMSPEQTGLMNRRVDYRSDFYSLGVTFYQLLTSKRPFSGKNKQQLINVHITMQPKPLYEHRANIPQMLNDIILKLLAKNPEERYQTNAGLLADLQHCQQQYQQKGWIEAFTIGQTDIAHHFALSEKLYGRRAQVKSLYQAFDHSCSGEIAAALISGEAGIGKSTLVNELLKHMTRNMGWFISAKFEQFNRDTPFSALKLALGQIIQKILNQTQEQQQHWRQQILSTIGEQGQILIDFIPQLEDLIGTQPSVTVLSGEAANHRFNQLILTFMQVIATKKFPLILFLDDLQWSDVATLQLLEVLLNKKKYSQMRLQKNNHSLTSYLDVFEDSISTSPALLLIGAWRNNETSDSHPLQHTLEQLKRLNVFIQNIQLNGLEEKDVCDMLIDVFQCQMDYAQPLAQLLLHKTKGNPFYVHQLLQYIAELKLVQYDFQQEHWYYDLPAITQLTEHKDVISFLANRLKQLEPPILQIMQVAACLGQKFDVKLLAKILEMDISQCAMHCFQAVQQELIYSLDANLHLACVSESEQQLSSLTIECHFAHDHIQQAASSLLEQQYKTQVHLKIAQILEQQQMNSSDHIFLLVNQYNAARTLIVEPEACQKIAHLNLQSSKRARKATAYETALQYAQTGLSYLGDNCWDSNYALTLALYNETIEALFLIGDYEQQERMTEQLLTKAHNLYDTLHSHQYYCQSLIVQSQPQAALDYTLPILKQLDLEFPVNPKPEDILNELAKTQTMIAQKLDGKPIAALVDLPLMKDKQSLAILCLLESLEPALYICASSLYRLATFKRIQLVLNKGNAKEVIPYYASYDYLLSSLTYEINQGYKFGLLALSLLDKLKAQAQKSSTFVCVYGTQYFKQYVKNSVVPLREGAQSGLEVGNLHYAAGSLMWSNVYAFFSGMELSELEETMQCDKQVMQGSHQNLWVNYSENLHELITNLLTHFNQFKKTYNDKSKIVQCQSQHEQAGDHFALCLARLLKAIFAYLMNSDNALALIDMASKYQDSIVGNILSPELAFYRTLIMLRVYHQQPSTEQSVWLQQIEADRQTIAKLAQHAPMNFQHKYDLITAEYYRTQYDSRAEKYYDKAIQGAETHGYIQVEAFACELAAQYYLSLRSRNTAESYLTQAYSCYAHWGAKAKSSQIEELYPDLLKQRKTTVLH